MPLVIYGLEGTHTRHKHTNNHTSDFKKPVSTLFKNDILRKQITTQGNCKPYGSILVSCDDKDNASQISNKSK